ncbi:hypothetical protein [Winogradskyella sp. UBA3174]|uniref:hypothetical protein n=1 Tax=Winogradskyella sp. UBA3174 TaxID=1947785 RepID=UPI0025F7839B|nr:hypothetical protein [Winogradskyella sp. UBA3174]|tara:strand:- start:19156 stop:19665 length:510 start_codon:yes stop_codon:yes gene_type:complete
MKRIISFISVFALLLTACTGDQGPPGFNGEDGGILVSNAFEIENVNFNPSSNFENDYRVREFYGFDVFPTDVTLVYILWEIRDGQEVWRLVPQTVIFNDGNDLVYNFDFTQTYVDFFLEGSNLDILDGVWTQGQVFRVVVVPAVNIGRLDFSDLNAVMEMYGITEFEKR